MRESVSTDKRWRRLTGKCLRYAGILGVSMALCGAMPSVAHAQETEHAFNSAEIGRNDHYIVIIAERGESYANLAAEHLGDPSADWYVAKYNDNRPIRPGKMVIVPRSWRNVGGVENTGYKVVPVLSYHNFGPSDHQLSVKPENFREQLSYLRDNEYNVIRLSDLLGFLNGDRGIPDRAVVITIDDGYQSAYKIAFPLLLEFGFPATVFPYSDFLNQGGLKSAQLKEMVSSGLIDIQAHSKMHTNLSEISFLESTDDYARRVAIEVETPVHVFKRLLGNKIHSFAYPYGGVTGPVIGQVSSNNYSMGFTVSGKSNGFFANPYLLSRTMVFNEHTLEAFAALLVVHETY